MGSLNFYKYGLWVPFIEEGIEASANASRLRKNKTIKKRLWVIRWRTLESAESVSGDSEFADG
jgi:hypothetical protein